MYNLDKKNLTKYLGDKKSVSLKNGKVFYRESGAGIPIFFLHGMSGESSSWVYQLEGLKDQYRIIAWDAPGYAQSTAIDCDIATLAETAFDFLQSIGASNPILVGHSMGGVIAGKMAIDRPEKIKALVLSCTHWGWGITPGEPLISRYTKRLDELNTMNLEDYAKLRASKMISPNIDEDISIYLGELSKSVSSEAIKYVGRANQEANNLDGLSKLNIPTFILIGEIDKVIKADKTEILAANMPCAKQIFMKNVGHAPYVEDPESYNSIIQSIAKEVLS